MSAIIECDVAGCDERAPQSRGLRGTLPLGWCVLLVEIDAEGRPITSCEDRGKLATSHHPKRGVASARLRRVPVISVVSLGSHQFHVCPQHPLVPLKPQPFLRDLLSDDDEVLEEQGVIALEGDDVNPA